MIRFKTHNLITGTKLLIFCLLGSLHGIGLIAQNTVINKAFQEGEQLVYKVSYSSALGDFNAGTATVTVKKLKIDSISKEKYYYHIIGIGETNNFFDFFYKVRDRFESVIDTETLLPRNFVRRTREADYIYDDDVIFNRKNNTATSRRTTKQVPESVHDIISAVYFMRTLTVDDFGEDSTYYINFFLDDSVYHSHVLYEGRGFLETEWGWLPCLKVKPMMATGEVFSQKYPMSVWITDDSNHIPVMAESEIIVGSVRMVLADYKGLKNTFIKPVKRKQLK